MAISKQKKQEIIAKLAGVMKSAKTLVFVNFKGLKVSDSVTLRNNLKAEKVDYYVAKKTLLKKVLAENKFTGEAPSLDGEVALAYAPDELAPARLVQQFAEKLKEGLKIIGGVFDGKYLNAPEMVAIAKIPARPVLLGQLVNLINSPIAGLVVALNEIAKKRAP
ncbi:MAG: 50S ribosomal protein L10 [Patescibacteria group bacterium]